MKRKKKQLQVCVKRHVSTLLSGYRRLACFGLLGFLPMSVMAQVAEVNRELSNVTGQLSQLAGTIVNIVKILAGILAVVALITLVMKFQEGDHEAKKKLMMWLGGLVVLFFALSIVQSLFRIG